MTTLTKRRLNSADIVHARTIAIADIVRDRRITLKRTGREMVGPCPHCGGVDRFAIHTTENLFNCRGCGCKGAGAISFVRWLDGVDFRDAVEALVGGRNAPSRNKPTTNSSESDDRRRQREKAAWLWSQRLPILGSPADIYLREVRGIACSLPPTLAFLPASKPEQHSAMIAAFGMCDEIEPGIIAAPREIVAIHLTLLKPDGSGKIEVEPNKIMIGSPSGWPIVISTPSDLLGLAVTEGIENGLSICQALGLGVWVAGSAPHMSKLGDTVPDWIDCVTVYADADADRQGERNAGVLAKRLRERGIEVFIEGLDG